MAVLKNGCTFVNMGTYMQLPTGLEVEVMGRAYSSHVADLVGTYLRSSSGQASKILLYVDKYGCCYISFFKELKGNHAYSSKKYETIAELPNKYHQVYHELIQAHRLLFGNS